MQRVGLILQLYVVMVVLLLIVHHFGGVLFRFLYPERVLVDDLGEHGQRQNGVLALQHQTVGRLQLSWNELDVDRLLVIETVFWWMERTRRGAEEVSIRLDCPIELHRS